MRRDIPTRWKLIFENSLGVDLRQIVRDAEGINGSDPCEDGLRSVCWKAFLLYGPLSRASWPKQLADSRSTYVSLRDHFLRFINHPNDLHSNADPLADDDTSPWASLRQDEIAREEIFNDVTRCMQDNFFFREPETQRMLLDILFIYAKLNPDLGYRQGMHELLAPLLWVVQQDAVDNASEHISASDRQLEGFEFMLDVLDHEQREADAFGLFCAVMQTAKSFYEMGDNRDSSPIIARSRRIHDDLLGTFDSELALHLQVAGVLPQIYAIRWVRLLFGREFDFSDVLRLWDILFAEKLRSDIIDLTCVAMLLRMRWTLVDADYSTAITTLTHVKLPSSNDGLDSRDLVRDALSLDQSRTHETGSDLIQKYSGRRPKPQQQQPERARLSLDQVRTPDRRGSRTPQYKPSPILSPARFTGPQKQLESLFNDVSGGIKSRTEGWTNVSRAVRGAVGEVRRNMAQYQPSHSRDTSVDVSRQHISHSGEEDFEVKALQQKLKDLEDRNKALARMLDGALDSLRSSRDEVNRPDDGKTTAEDTFNISLAKIQFVSVYLSDPDIPIPPEDFSTKTSRDENEETSADDSGLDNETNAPGDSGPQRVQRTDDSKPEAIPDTSKVGTTDPSPQVPDHKKDEAEQDPVEPPPKPPRPEKSSQLVPPQSSPLTRPSLQDASFSFMLGENRHRSSFVTSVNALPEHVRRESNDQAEGDKPGNRRGSEVKQGGSGRALMSDSSRENQRPGKGKMKGKKEGNKDAEDEEGWRMSSFHGGQGPL